MSRGTTDSLITRAWGYPWERPGHAFIFLAGVARPLGPWDSADPLMAQLGRGAAAPALADGLTAAGIDPDGWAASPRSGLLAYGSNAAPSQLLRKYPDASERAIPVTEVVVDNVDVVFSAHLTSYGSLPATIHRTPGACAHLSVTWLTDEERSVMHRTEGGNYRLEAVPGLEGVSAYVSEHGAALLGGHVQGLSAINVSGAGRRRLDQREALGQVAADHFAGLDARSLSEKVIADPEFRGKATATLAAHARPAVLGDGPAILPSDLT